MPVRAVGQPPMEYLLAWRMAVVKDLLRRHDPRIDEVAERFGYGLASTFSTALSRHGPGSKSLRASVRTSCRNATAWVAPILVRARARRAPPDALLKCPWTEA
jgi:hypothetical protein